VYTTGQDRGGV